MLKLHKNWIKSLLPTFPEIELPHYQAQLSVRMGECANCYLSSRIVGDLMLPHLTGVRLPPRRRKILIHTFPLLSHKLLVILYSSLVEEESTITQIKSSRKPLEAAHKGSGFPEAQFRRSTIAESHEIDSISPVFDTLVKKPGCNCGKNCDYSLM